MSTYLGDGAGDRINIGGGDLVVSRSSPLIANPAGDIRVSVWAPDRSLLFKVDASSDLVGGQSTYEDTPSGCGAGSLALGLRYEERLARGYWQGGNLVEIFTGDNILAVAIAGCSAGGTQKLYLDSTWTLDPAQGEDQQVVYLWDGANLTMQLPIVSTTTTAAITHSGSVQSVPVISSSLFTVGDQFSIGLGANCETVTIVSKPDATHIRAIFTKNHLLGEVLTSIGSDSGGAYVNVTTPYYGGGIPAYGALSTTVGRRRYQGRIERCSQIDEKSPNGTITLVGMTKAFTQAVGSLTLTQAANVDVGTAIYGALSQLAPGHWPFFSYGTTYQSTVNPGLFGLVGTIYGNSLTNVGADRIIADALAAIPLDTWVVRVGHDLTPRLIKLFDGTALTYTYNTALDQNAIMFAPVTVESDDEDISGAFNTVLTTGDQDPATKQPFAAIVDDANSIQFFGYQIDAQPVSNTACKSAAACAAYGQGQLNQFSGPVASQKFVVYTRYDSPSASGPGGVLQGDIVRAVSCVSVTGFQTTSLLAPPTTNLTAGITSTGRQQAYVTSTGLMTVGMLVTVGSGGGAETVAIIGINSPTVFTANFTRTHANGSLVTLPATFTPPNLIGLGVSVVSKLDFSKLDRWQEVQFAAIEPSWANILNERANALAQAILSNTLTGVGLDQYFVDQSAYQGITTSGLVVSVPAFEAVFALNTPPVFCGGNSFALPASSTTWIWLQQPAFTNTIGAITHGGSPQSVHVGSTASMVVGQGVIVDPGGVNQETVTVTAIADPTHFSGVFTNDHAGGVTVETNGGSWNLQNGPATQIGQILFAIATTSATAVQNIQQKAALGLLQIPGSYLLGGVAYTPTLTNVSLAVSYQGYLQSQFQIAFRVTNQPVDGSLAKIMLYYRQVGQVDWLLFATRTPQGPAPSTTTGQSITHGASPQSVLVASSQGLKTGMLVNVDTGANEETVTLTNVADSTHVSAVFTVNHSNGVALAATNGTPLQNGVTSAIGDYVFNYPDGANGINYEWGVALESLTGTETVVVSLGTLNTNNGIPGTATLNNVAFSAAKNATFSPTPATARTLAISWIIGLLVSGVAPSPVPWLASYQIEMGAWDGITIGPTTAIQVLVAFKTSQPLLSASALELLSSVQVLPNFSSGGFTYSYAFNFRLIGNDGSSIVLNGPSYTYQS